MERSWPEFKVWGSCEVLGEKTQMKSSDKLSFQTFSCGKSLLRIQLISRGLILLQMVLDPLKHNSNNKVHELNYSALLALEDIPKVSALGKLGICPRLQKKRKGKAVHSADSSPDTLCLLLPLSRPKGRGQICLYCWKSF